ncbi:MAG: hypothetical protein Q9163_001056 [Psora crenata]
MAARFEKLMKFLGEKGSARIIINYLLEWNYSTLPLSNSASSATKGESRSCLVVDHVLKGILFQLAELFKQQSATNRESVTSQQTGPSRFSQTMATLTGDEKALARPMNVEQIVRMAQDFDYNPLIPMKYWLRTAGTLLKEAEIYEHEGNDQQTYLLLYRHAQLVIKYLSTNPDAKQPQNRFALIRAQRDVHNNLKKLEVLKPRINKRYERYEQLMRDRDARRATASAPRDFGGTTPIGHKRVLSDPAVSKETEALAAAENRDLAVRLAHKEIKRRATARKATWQAGISNEVQHERRTAGLWGNWEEALTSNDGILDRETLSRQMQNVRSQVDGTSKGDNANERRRPSFEGRRSNFHYPTVPQHSSSTDWASPAPERSSFETHASQRQPPELPPKKKTETFLLDESPPGRPPKQAFTLSNGDAESATPPSPPPRPPPPPDLKPSEFTFKPSAYLENGTPLRTIFLPPDLRHQFLSIASPNTQANLETCGILCGTLVSNALFVSKLVIPDQESTSDTCETINESDLFDYVDGEDLMVLGWIHTHPTQTCFMSSRDLHTHGGYQVMMPESIAIVCAPSKGEWGVFRLTDPPGMQTVLNCTQTGLFHPHAEKNVYTDALKPGHVYEAKGLEFDVVDLRPR